MLQDKWFQCVDGGNVVGCIADARTIDKPASDEARTTIYKMTPVLLAKIAGQHDISSQAIKPHNKAELCARFPGAWEHYESQKAGEATASPLVSADTIIKGTTLDKADFVPRAQAAFLVTMGFSTIEQLAAMADDVAQNLKGGNQLRKKAIEFLKRT